MIIYRVYEGSYEGEYTIRAFENKAVAITFARTEARKTNEEFTGNVGHGIAIETLNSTTGKADRLEGWHDWKTTISGARFVLAED